MYQNDRSVVRTMRMCIILGRLSMGRPAGVADTEGNVYAPSVVCLLRKDFQSSLCLNDRDISCGLIAHCNPR